MCVYVCVCLCVSLSVFLFISCVFHIMHLYLIHIHIPSYPPSALAALQPLHNTKQNLKEKPKLNKTKRGKGKESLCGSCSEAC